MYLINNQTNKCITIDTDSVCSSQIRPRETKFYNSIDFNVLDKYLSSDRPSIRLGCTKNYERYLLNNRFPHVKILDWSNHDLYNDTDKYSPNKVWRIESGKKYCLILLGLYGDIICSLPLAKYVADKSQNKVMFVTSKPFSKLFTKSTFPHINEVIVHYTMSQIVDCYSYIKSVFPDYEVIPIQYGFNPLSAYNFGYSHYQHWQKFPYQLVDNDLDITNLTDYGFVPTSDINDEKLYREIHNLSKSKLNIAINLSGVTSPIDSSNIDFSNENRVNLVDISKLRFNEFNQLITFMSKFDGCISIDSSPLHIAEMLNIPTIAICPNSDICSSLPNRSWVGSCISYDEFSSESLIQGTYKLINKLK